jgi:non-ribosomal peptide synthetase component E (peptide arylation enzyme)
MTGRIKDIINRGGEKFSAQDIENVVMTHPAVRAAAILAVADRRLGEEVACFVQLQSDADWPGAEALYAHLDASHLARQKFPKYWQVVDALPLTASGKVKKDVLLRIWEAQTPPKHNEAAGSKKLPEPKKQ